MIFFDSCDFYESAVWVSITLGPIPAAVKSALNRTLPADGAPPNSIIFAAAWREYFHGS